MTNLFRNRYPSASIISELVSDRPDKYVVRVSLENDGKILSTGLAQNQDVEVAETRAIERAISHLHLETNSNKVTKKKAVQPPERKVSQPTKEKVEPPLNSGSKKEEPTTVKSSQKPELSPPKEQPQIEATPTENQEVIEVDFGDLIARSNVELKRLKWTTDQGREYLVRTYGKRSRQNLSDEELFNFLHHLEHLPTPS